MTTPLVWSLVLGSLVACVESLRDSGGVDERYRFDVSPLLGAAPGLWSVSVFVGGSADYDDSSMSVLPPSLSLPRALAVCQHYADNGDWPSDLLIVSEEVS